MMRILPALFVSLPAVAANYPDPATAQLGSLFIEEAVEVQRSTCSARFPASRPLWVAAVNADGKTSILEREVAPANGTIFNSWSVAAGDPPGRYTIRLFVADAKPIVFEFEVR